MWMVKHRWCHDTHEEAECFICSECGGRFNGWTEDDGGIRYCSPAFCPNCGAAVEEQDGRIGA